VAKLSESLFGVDAVQGHQHAFGLLYDGSALQRAVDGIGHVAGGFEAREVTYRA
jgi:hypothetical protein